MKLERSMRLFLVFVTTVSVLLLGIEGYNSLVETNYLPAYSDQLLIVGVMAIVLWLGGFKGIDILKSAGIIGEEKYDVQNGDVVKKFKPANDFFENTPNEVAFTITNPTQQKGIRFRFLSQDTVSPPLVEMPVPPGQSAIFKTSITPISTGTRNIMVVVYPLFDDKGQYIDENSAEPYTNQSVNYKVQSETQIGISKDQQSTLKKLLVLVVGIGAIVFGGGQLAQQLLGNANLYALVRDNAPFLLALQGPFVYAFFYIQNKSKVIKGEMDSLIEQINAMDNLAKEMNSKLDQSILKSSTFKKNMSSVLKTTLSSVTGLSAMKELNDIIGKQISDSLGENFTDQVSKVVKTQDLTLFSTTATKVISDNFSGDINKLIDDEKSSLMSTAETQVSSQVTDAVTSQLPDSVSSQISTPSVDQTPVQASSQEPTTSPFSLLGEKKKEAKDAVKAKIKEKYGDKIKKQTSKELAQVLKDKSEDSFINQYKGQLMTDFKKTLSKEFRKQIKDGKLVDDIEEKVFEALGPEIQKQILDQINSTVFNRDILSSLAEDLDKQLGSNLTSEFEDTIGTAMESEMGEKLKQHLNVKYEKEVMEKLNKTIKTQIRRQLNKRGDTIIDELLNSKLTDVIQNKMFSAIQDSITKNLDTVVDKAIDVSVDTAFAV